MTSARATAPRRDGRPPCAPPRRRHPRPGRAQASWLPRGRHSSSAAPAAFGLKKVRVRTAPNSVRRFLRGRAGTCVRRPLSPPPHSDVDDARAITFCVSVVRAGFGGARSTRALARGGRGVGVGKRDKVWSFYFYFLCAIVLGRVEIPEYVRQTARRGPLGRRDTVRMRQRRAAVGFYARDETRTSKLCCVYAWPRQVRDCYETEKRKRKRR